MFRILIIFLLFISCENDSTEPKEPKNIDYRIIIDGHNNGFEYKIALDNDSLIVGDRDGSTFDINVQARKSIQVNATNHKQEVSSDNEQHFVSIKILQKNEIVSSLKENCSKIFKSNPDGSLYYVWQRGHGVLLYEIHFN